MPATRHDDESVPADPAEILPADSVLSFDEYIAMQRAIGEETRYRVLHYLKHAGATRPMDLKAALDVPGNTLHHHLNRLMEVGLVEKRAQNAADTTGVSVSYRATAFGSAILDHGVESLLATEQTYRELYGTE